MNPSSKVIEQAINWMVQLQSGHATPADYDACQHWQQTSPEHQLAWDRLNGVNQQVQLIPPALAHATLNNEKQTKQRINAMLQRRQLLKLIVLTGGSAGLFSLGYQKLPWRPMLADYSTKVGERQHIALEDGGNVHLNTSSALDIQFDAHLRILKFYQGEMLITTGHESGVYRPFLVDTPYGQLRALGTRFLVREEKSGIRLSVFDGAVEVSAGGGQQVVPAGQSLHFTQKNIETMQTANPDSLGWTNGVMVARNMRLDDFLHELNRYRHGYLDCDSTLADMRISGVFPLSDINKVLEAVSDTLKVSVKRSWHYWIRIVPAA